MPQHAQLCRHTPDAAHDPCEHCAARLFSICDALAPDDLARLGALTTSLAFEPGATLLHQDDPATHCFNITAGSAKAYKLLPDGRRQVTGFLFTGDFIGTAARGRYSVSIEAMTPLRLCRFDRREFQDALRRMPALENALLERTSDELEAAREQMLLLGRKAAKERVGSFLLSLSDRARRLRRPADPVQLPMTRTDIADYLGLTTETISRVLTQLRTEGLIRLEGHSAVHLLRRSALQALGAGE